MSGQATSRYNGDIKSLNRSAHIILEQPPPPTLREILSAYTTKGDGDREMLLAMLNAKSSEDQLFGHPELVHHTIHTYHVTCIHAAVVVLQLVRPFSLTSMTSIHVKRLIHPVHQPARSRERMRLPGHRSSCKFAATIFLLVRAIVRAMSGDEDEFAQYFEDFESVSDSEWDAVLSGQLSSTITDPDPLRHEVAPRPEAINENAVAVDPPATSDLVRNEHEQPAADAPALSDPAAYEDGIEFDDDVFATLDAYVETAIRSGAPHI
ncbi:hypothetical protein FISHEDRAFT_56853 [Fistulina hepatica ATCC 64428]|uniref:Uncharacterized protein n=1 Tax=Fistulina hepatica ATCC 64428 TaxID=1128425 RepID=A0A0D7AKN7_9AGAR|nr:hypothetical protein FISHEDRAFT_56853 [Fistulina hepatica ATCC 64428]